MNVIQVKFDIDIDNEQQLESFNVFVQSLKASGGTAKVEAPVKDIKPKATQPAATQQAATSVASQTTQPAATQQAASQTPPDGVSKKLFEIRQLIGSKAATHRDVMIAKLNTYGVGSATDLAVDKYDEFHEYLLSL